VADRRKDEFLATLAHELRNPLAHMVNSLSMMNGPESTEAAPRAKEIIQRQLAHMVRLVDDLLDVSRITRGKLAVHAKRVELAGIIQSAVDTVQPVMDARRHELIVTLPEEPVYVQGDPVRLSQVFSNLLNNAAKYSEPEGSVRLTAAASADRLEIVITDDGIGISAETLPIIFEMFTQGDGSVERTQSGLGVGLALTRRLIELHGGTVEARSPGLGKGSTFTVTLPLAAAPAELNRDTAPDPDAAAARSRRILLVDDNVDFATSLAMLLEGLGHVVRVAHNGGEGIEVAADLQPEIAFLDIGLPVMSGYELARRLRALPASKDTVLVALSGWGQEDDRRRSREAGFAAHLVKPVELHKIESILEAMVPNP
jgi:two-component system, sensor histidine kinase